MVKVTVIVPVYNVEKYLRECLDSILEQTLKDIEIICVNDGSTDSSYEILKEYEKKDNRIFVITKDNKGYGHTINTGLEVASGEYICIIESDDFAERNMLEIMYKAATKYDADSVRCNCYNYNGKDIYIENLRGFKYDTPFSPKDNPNVYLIAPCTYFLWKRNLFVLNNIRLNETGGASYQDISFQFQMWFYSETVVFLREALIHYRINNSSSSVNDSKKVFCVCDEYEYIEDIIRKSNRNCTDIIPYVIKSHYEVFEWNYSRVSAEYQYAFLVRWRELLLENLKLGILKEELFSSEVWENITAIVNEMDDFFEKTAKVYYKRGLEDKIINYKIYADALIEHMSKNDNIIIFGCGILGQKIANELWDGYKIAPKCFVVSNVIQNVANKIPVISISNMKKECEKNSLIVVTTQEKDYKEIIIKLNMQGFENVMVIEDNVRKFI